MKEYIDLTEEFKDLQEMYALSEAYDHIPELLEENGNTEITKIYLDYKKKYNAENKECKAALKAKDYSKATRCAKNMKEIVADMKKDINAIPADLTGEAIQGTIFSVLLSAVQVLFPTALLAGGAILNKTSVGRAINTAQTGIRLYAGVNASNLNMFIGALKTQQEDMKAYQKADLKLETPNGYKIKMLSYCNRLSANLDVLIKQIKAEKIMNS